MRSTLSPTWNYVVKGQHLVSISIYMSSNLYVLFYLIRYGFSVYTYILLALYFYCYFVIFSYKIRLSQCRFCGRIKLYRRMIDKHTNVIILKHIQLDMEFELTSLMHCSTNRQPYVQSCMPSTLGYSVASAIYEELIETLYVY